MRGGNEVKEREKEREREREGMNRKGCRTVLVLAVVVVCVPVICDPLVPVEQVWGTCGGVRY